MGGVLRYEGLLESFLQSILNQKFHLIYLIIHFSYVKVLEINIIPNATQLKNHECCLIFLEGHFTVPYGLCTEQYKQESGPTPHRT